MKMLSLTLAAALSAFGCCAETVLENDALRIVFGSAEQGFGIQSIENKLAGGARFVHPTGKGCDFWHIAFARQNEKTRCIDRLFSFDNQVAARERTCERDGDTVRFHWRGIALAGEPDRFDVTAEVVLPPGKAASRWRITTANRSVKAAVFNLSYPCLQDVVKSGEGDAMLPSTSQGAVLRRAWKGEKYPRESISPGWQSPVAAFFRGSAGLYVAAHDPDLRTKSLVAGPSCACRFVTPVENSGIVGKAAAGPGYEVVIAAFGGDWWDAARLYRDWATQQRWATEKGPIAQRRDFPSAMRDTDIWIGFKETSAASASNRMVRIRKAFPDAKVGIHWYVWHNSDFDVNFPEFFPARRGLEQVIDFGRRLGFVVMPYVDLKIWDMDLSSWVYVREDACRRHDGKFYVESWPVSNRQFADMCPSSSRWKEVISTVSHHLIETNTTNRTGFNAVYYDQFACADACPCYAEQHGHPLGGGAWWAEHYRAALRPMHELFSAQNYPITSEGTGEFCLGLVDGFLAMGSKPSPDDLPFHPVVYSGYGMFFGSSISLKVPDESFFRYQAHNFVYGLVPGPYGRWDITLDEFAAKRAYLERCIRFRRAARTYLVEGRIEGELKVLGELPTAKYDCPRTWQEYYQVKDDTVWEFPDVFATVWSDSTRGGVAVVVANCAKTPQTIRFQVPAAGLRPVAMDGLEVSEYAEAKGIGTLTIPPRGFALLE